MARHCDAIAAVVDVDALASRAWPPPHGALARPRGCMRYGKPDMRPATPRHVRAQRC